MKISPFDIPVSAHVPSRKVKITLTPEGIRVYNAVLRVEKWQEGAWVQLFQMTLKGLFLNMLAAKGNPTWTMVIGETGEVIL